MCIRRKIILSTKTIIEYDKLKYNIIPYSIKTIPTYGKKLPIRRKVFHKGERLCSNLKRFPMTSETCP